MPFNYSIVVQLPSVCVVAVQDRCLCVFVSCVSVQGLLVC